MRLSLSESRPDVLCWSSLQTMYQLLNCVDRPSKTRDTINNIRHAFFANIIVMFAACFVQEEMLETGFSQESVHTQEVFASKNTCSYWWKKAPHHQWQNYIANYLIWLLRNRQKRWRKIDSSSYGDRERYRCKFGELKDLWHLACLESIVSVVCLSFSVMADRCVSLLTKQHDLCSTCTGPSLSGCSLV